MIPTPSIVGGTVGVGVTLVGETGTLPPHLHLIWICLRTQLLSSLFQFCFNNLLFPFRAHQFIEKLIQQGPTYGSFCLQCMVQSPQCLRWLWVLVGAISCKMSYLTTPPTDIRVIHTLWVCPLLIHWGCVIPRITSSYFRGFFPFHS